MRGIIADCRFNGDQNSISISSGIDPYRLRQYLLYWDQIDYPVNNLLHVGLTPDEEYLKEIGVLKRTQFTISTGPEGIVLSPEIFVQCQLRALELNNENKGEIWSLGQHGAQLVLPKDKSKTVCSAQLELYECIPVPSEDTPFEDILYFKEKRRAELSEFRDLMDGMYDTIISSENMDLQQKRCIEKLQNKIIDINRVMKESRMKRILSSLKVELNASSLTDSLIKAYAGYHAGEKIGFPEVGAVLGLLSSAVSVSYDMSVKPNQLPDELKDYAYLFYAKKEIL